MRNRLKDVREALAKALAEKEKNLDFSFITQQKGLFSYIGLSEDESKRLREQYAIYLPNSGRINIAGINKRNLEYVVDSILAVMESNKTALKTKVILGGKPGSVHA